MDYLSWTTFVVFLHCLAVQGYPRSSRQTTDCRKCKPGYYAYGQCTATRDTQCRRCPDDHFTSEWNTLIQCYPCSKCGQGLFELKHCTRVSDVFCESCASTEWKTSARYKEHCWGLDPDAAELLSDQPASDVTDYLSDEPEPDEDKDGNVIPIKGETSYLELGENDNGVEKEEEDSSGQVELEVVPSGNYTEEDIKTTNLQLKEKSDPGAVDITEVDLEEGSGYVISEEPTMDEELSELLAQSATVEPQDAVQDELIPVRKGTTTPAPTVDVVDLDLSEEGSGLVIEDLTNITVGEPVMATSPPQLTEETSELLVELQYSGEEELVDGSTSTVHEIVVLTKAQTTTKLPPDYDENEEQEEEDEEDEVLPPEENKVEASIEEPLAQGSMDGKTRTAVIVGVATGAVVFFALGFFASRQCKKRHSFKSMKKIEAPQTTQNGSTEAIEFRGGLNSEKYDPGAYDRNIPVSPQTESVVLLSSKPLPYDPSLTNQDNYVNGLDKIRYMDETTEYETTDNEAETASPRDRLLKQEHIPKIEEEEKGNNSLSSDVMNKFDDKLAPIEEERQPMLAKDSGDTNESS